MKPINRKQLSDNFFIGSLAGFIGSGILTFLFMITGLDIQSKISGIITFGLFFVLLSSTLLMQISEEETTSKGECDYE